MAAVSLPTLLFTRYHSLKTFCITYCSRTLFMFCFLFGSVLGYLLFSLPSDLFSCLYHSWILTLPVVASLFLNETPIFIIFSHLVCLNRFLFFYDPDAIRVSEGLSVSFLFLDIVISLESATEWGQAASQMPVLKPRILVRDDANPKRSCRPHITREYK